MSAFSIVWLIAAVVLCASAVLFAYAAWTFRRVAREIRKQEEEYRSTRLGYSVKEIDEMLAKARRAKGNGENH